MSWSGLNHKPPSIPFTDSLECRTWTAVQLQKTQSGPKPHSWQVQASTKWFRFKVLRSADICRGSKWCLIQPAKTDSHLITLLPLRIFFSFQTWLNPVEDATWQTCHRFINPPIHHPMRSHIGKVPWGWSSAVFFCVQSGTNLFRFIIILTFSLHTTLSSVLCTMDEHEWLCWHGAEKPKIFTKQGRFIDGKASFDYCRPGTATVLNELELFSFCATGQFIDSLSK